MFKRPKVMGILNVTPDSFSDGGRYDTLDLAVKQGLELIDAGADILDIGGESTRPGAEQISVKEEVRRTVPVIIELRDATRDFDIGPVISVAADLACPLILMHAQGSPENMQDNPLYEHTVSEIKDWLSKRIDACEFAGIERDMITIDPGIGFGKRQEDNLAIFNQLGSFKDLGCPLLMGASRKSFIGRIDGSAADDRLGGSIAAALWSAQAGASILRVHDVSETVQALKVWEAIEIGG